MYRPVGDGSRGIKRQAGFIRSFVADEIDPPVAILQEPFAHLDDAVMDKRSSSGNQVPKLKGFLVYDPEVRVRVEIPALLLVGRDFAYPYV